MSFIEVNALSDDGTNTARTLVPIDRLLLITEIHEKNRGAFTYLGISEEANTLIAIEGVDTPIFTPDSIDDINDQL